MPAWIHTLTVDASYDETRRITGVGVVVQERVNPAGRGPIVERIAEGHTGVVPGSGEMFAVLRALELAMDRGFTRIKIRSDCNAMRRDLRERHRAGDAGDIDVQRKVLGLARQFVWVDFGYVPRRKNQIAHALARKGRADGPIAPYRTREGAEREQLRRWAELSLEEIVLAQEEMQKLAERLATAAGTAVKKTS